MLVNLFVSFTIVVLFVTFVVTFVVTMMSLIFKYVKKLLNKPKISNRTETNNSTHPVSSDKIDFHPESEASNAKLQGAHITQQAVIAENAVEDALRQLRENRYFVFRDLIIPSSSQSMTLTQIDHIVVSRKGIFCIETKSNNGHIYGFSRSENWKQYLGNSGKPYLINSPFRQNRHHVSSLEVLLSSYLKAPVHSYISFPNARKVVVDSKIEDMSPKGIIAKISKHDRDVYDYSDVENIAKTLAHAGSLRDKLRNRHIDDVKAYLNAKVSGTLKLS